MTNSITTIGSASDPSLFKKAMGKFATGVTIVATVDERGKKWGMTANSFSSVSLDPPLVSICIAKRAASLKTFLNNKNVGISILANDQHDIALRFSKPYENKFQEVTLNRMYPSTPMIEGASASLSCEIVNTVDAGDHIILILEVKTCVISDNSSLGYHEGKFFDSEMSYSPSYSNAPKTRKVEFGWLLENNGKILLNKDRRSKLWSIPKSSLGPEDTIYKAMLASSKLLFGIDVEPVFLYSTTDLDSETTCYIYRATTSDSLPEGEMWGLFDQESLPWKEISNPSLIPMFKRYFFERERDEFGLFLNLGNGKVVETINEKSWSLFAMNKER